MSQLPTLAVVGATGVVGTVMCELLSARKDVWGEIRVVASKRSVGKTLFVRGQALTVMELSPSVFQDVDVAIFDVPDEIAAEWAPIAASLGAIVIDTSAAFRLDTDVPLVVPEINPERIRDRPRGIIANANCTAMTVIVGIAPLHQEYGLKELVLSTYQAVSATGKAGVDTLLDQLERVGREFGLGSRSGNVRQAVGDELGPFPAPVALNVVPWAGGLQGEGWASEELKIRNEVRKVLGLPDLKVSATCVRVPVVTCNSVAVHAVFSVEVDADDARDVLRQAPGVIVVDDPADGEYPMPIDAVGTDPFWIGRIRRSIDDPRSLDFFVTGDNLRKGTALNVIQIAETLAREFNGDVR